MKKLLILTVLTVFLALGTQAQNWKPYFHSLDVKGGLKLQNAPNQKGTGSLTIDENGLVGSNPCITDTLFYLTTSMLPPNTIYFHAKGCMEITQVNPYTIRIIGIVEWNSNNFAHVFSGGAQPIDTIIQDGVWNMYFITDLDYANSIGVASPRVAAFTLANKSATEPSLIDAIAENIIIITPNGNGIQLVDSSLYFHGLPVGTTNPFARLGIDNTSKVFVDTTTLTSSSIYNSDGAINEDRTIDGDGVSYLTFQNQKGLEFYPSASFSISTNNYFNNSHVTNFSGSVIKLGLWSSNNDYIQVNSPLKNPRWTTANRPTAYPALDYGTQGFNMDLFKMEYWNGTTWVQY